MKTQLSKLTYMATALGIASWAVGQQGAAQPQADLDVQLHAGLTITGSSGTIYSVEYVADLSEPQEGDWQCLEFLQLPASPFLWTDKSAPATGTRFYRAVEMEPPANMVFIPPGTFRMGSPPAELDRLDNEGPQTEVIITKGYWMGQYEVTQREYEALIGDNPSYFTGDPNRPVEQVDWDMAVAYCEALTEREQAAVVIPANCAYRLSTEAEWEYACRALTSTRFSYGDDPDNANLSDYAWYDLNSGATTHPVGQNSPNPWNLYDMHGNVWEWCQDFRSIPNQPKPLPGGVVLDPQGPATGTGHPIRGGGWRHEAYQARSAYRNAGGTPDWAGYGIGFRVVLSPKNP